MDVGAEFTSSDFRSSLPRFSAENRRANGPIVEMARAVAAKKEVTPAPIALGWLRAQSRGQFRQAGSSSSQILHRDCVPLALATLAKCARSSRAGTAPHD
jgi:aryl-alcohol dehydrogenase-like predicted oxidoreductase